MPVLHEFVQYCCLLRRCAQNTGIDAAAAATLTGLQWSKKTNPAAAPPGRPASWRSAGSASPDRPFMTWIRESGPSPTGSPAKRSTSRATAACKRAEGQGGKQARRPWIALKGPGRLKCTVESQLTCISEPLQPQLAGTHLLLPCLDADDPAAGRQLPRDACGTIPHESAQLQHQIRPLFCHQALKDGSLFGAAPAAGSGWQRQQQQRVVGSGCW